MGREEVSKSSERRSTPASDKITSLAHVTLSEMIAEDHQDHVGEKTRSVSWLEVVRRVSAMLMAMRGANNVEC
ncbi:unnamed protein product [Choristocarpus tenellus]